MGRLPIKHVYVNVGDETEIELLAQTLIEAKAEVNCAGESAQLLRSLGVHVIEDADPVPGSAQPDYDLLVCHPIRAGLPSRSDGTPMIRAAAKRCRTVAVITSPLQYADAAEALRDGGFTRQERRVLAAEAFARIAAADAAESRRLSEACRTDDGTGIGIGTGIEIRTGADPIDGPMPAVPAVGVWRKETALRYGENFHQEAALYVAEPDPARGPTAGPAAGPTAPSTGLLHGKRLSYTNYVDCDAAMRAVYASAEPCVAVVKNANLCTIAVSRTDDIAEAHRLANAGDPVSAFGGTIAANRPVTEEMARQVVDVYTEAITAPDYQPAALDLLRTRKNIRVLRIPPPVRPAWDLREISGGVLVQAADHYQARGDDPVTWTLRSGPASGSAMGSALASGSAMGSALASGSASGPALGSGSAPGSIPRVTPDLPLIPDYDPASVPAPNVFPDPAPDLSPRPPLRLSPASPLSPADLVDPADSVDLADLAFAWRAILTARSRAVLLARGGAMVGLGAGQVDSADAAWLAVRHAADRARGAVAATDGPVESAKCIETLAAAGVTALVQPGGDAHDDEVIRAARKAGLTMYFTGVSHLAH